MKNVLVLMHDDAGQEARFQAALDLTRALDGHLTCLDVSVLPVFVGDYAALGGTALLMDQEQRQEAVNRTHMEARLRTEDVPYTWLDKTGFLSETVRESTGMADIVVLNLHLTDNSYPDMVELVGEVAVKTSKPILAVPAAAKGFDAFGPALVAWDGSAAAETALRAAVPILARAASVVILECDDGSLKQPATEAAAYLSRHHINSVVRQVDSIGRAPSAVILDTIAAIGAAYLVMGGFGHRRFVEALFGGVTRTMLKQSPVPLFLAH
jgi:nucleotide-binding universal stress UspA family protein